MKIENATPKIAENAKKLWNKIARQDTLEPKTSQTKDSAAPADAKSVHLTDFVEATRQSLEEIQKQQQQLMALVKSDERVMKALETGRARISRLTGICLATGLVALAGLALAIRLALQWAVIAPYPIGK